MRGTAPEETRIDRNESNYFPSRLVFAISATTNVVIFEFINTYYGSNDSVAVLQKMSLFLYILQFKWYLCCSNDSDDLLLKMSLFLYTPWLKYFSTVLCREAEGEGSSGSSSKSDDQFVKVRFPKLLTDFLGLRRKFSRLITGILLPGCYRKGILLLEGLWRVSYSHPEDTCRLLLTYIDAF